MENIVTLLPKNPPPDATTELLVSQIPGVPVVPCCVLISKIVEVAPVPSKTIPSRVIVAHPLGNVIDVPGAKPNIVPCANPDMGPKFPGLLIPVNVTNGGN